MNTHSIQTLIKYHIWANHQVWGCIETISEEQFVQDAGHSIGSIYNQIFHLMFTDWSTVKMLNNAMPAKEDPSYLQQAHYSDPSLIRAKWDEVETSLEAYVASLNDEQLQATMPLPKGDGTTFEATLWELLASLVNHGTNHRAQILALLGKYGGKTVEQGLYFYYMQRD